MTRLERILDLLNKYDGLAEASVKSHNSILGCIMLKDLREEKEKLTKELIEYGCRRKY
jgi:hypothetical protein